MPFLEGVPANVIAQIGVCGAQRSSRPLSFDFLLQETGQVSLPPQRDAPAVSRVASSEAAESGRSGWGSLLPSWTLCQVLWWGFPGNSEGTSSLPCCHLPWCPSWEIPSQAEQSPSGVRQGMGTGSLRVKALSTWWLPRHPGTALKAGMRAEARRPSQPLCPWEPCKDPRAPAAQPWVNESPRIPRA